jgi:hypothetical protein
MIKLLKLLVVSLKTGKVAKRYSVVGYRFPSPQNAFRTSYGLDLSPL